MARDFYPELPARPVEEFRSSSEVIDWVLGHCRSRRVGTAGNLYFLFGENLACTLEKKPAYWPAPEKNPED